MFTRIKNFSIVAALVAGAAFFATSTARAAIVGPYTVDANTMHLFHFEDAANPILDDPAVTNEYQQGGGGFDGGNVGTVGHASFTGFGNAGRTNRLTGSNTTGIGTEERGWTQQTAVSPATLYGSDTTAFTIEAVLKFNQVGSNDFSQLIRTQNGDLQIKYSTAGGEDYLDFVTPDGTGTYTTGDLNIDTSKWYHAAFVYDGVGTTTDNVRIYFTEMDELNTEANLVSTFSTGVAGSNYTSNTFWIGSPSGGQANAMYDELRISNIARGADDMMFSGAVPEPSSIALAGLGLLGLAGYGVRRCKK